MSKEFEIFTDGACSGNPGPAGIGVWVTSDGVEVARISESIGEATNNIAEYRAMVRALEYAAEIGARRLKLRTDSELMFFQIKGKYKVKHPNMVPLHARVMDLLKGFEHIEIKAIPREENVQADRLATSALKRSLNTGPDGRPDVFVIGEESPSSTG